MTCAPLRMHTADGALDVPDLKPMYKVLMAAVAKSLVEVKATRDRLQHLEQRRELAESAVAATRHLEQARQEAEDARSGLNRSVRVRMGLILSDPSAKTSVSDLAAQWGGGSGAVDKASFRSNVSILLGLEGQQEAKEGGEIDEVFESIDEDGTCMTEQHGCDA
jgi:hypothetical protein